MSGRSGKPKTTVRISSAGVDIHRDQRKTVKGLTAAPPVKRSSQSDLTLSGDSMKLPPQRPNNALEAENKRLKKEIEVLRTEVKDKDDAILEHGAMVTTLTARVAELETAASTRASHTQSLSSELNDLKEQLSKTKMSLQKALGDLKDHQGKCEEHHGNHARLTSEVTDLHALVETQRGTIEGLQAENTSLAEAKNRDCERCAKTRFLEGEWHRSEKELETSRLSEARAKDDARKCQTELAALREAARQLKLGSEQDKVKIGDLQKETTLQRNLIEELKKGPETESYSSAMGNELRLMRESYEKKLEIAAAKLRKQELDYQETMRAMDETFRSERVLLKSKYDRQLSQLQRENTPSPFG